MTSSPLVDEHSVSTQHKKMKNRRPLLFAIIAPMVIVAASSVTLINDVPVGISLMITGSIALALMAMSYSVGYKDGFAAATDYAQWNRSFDNEETYAAEWLRLNKAMALRTTKEKQDDHASI